MGQNLVTFYAKLLDFEGPLVKISADLGIVWPISITI